MTEREFRLRARIDAVSDERDFYRSRVRNGKRYPSWCVYCGARTKTVKYPAACRAHSDLPELDPAYAEDLAA